MSSKITKKCGRPKKSASIAEPADIPDTKTASARRKSTKATTSTASKKTELVTPAVKPTKKPVTSTKSVPQPQQPQQQPKPLPQASQPVKKSSSPPPTTHPPPPSKILQEVFQKHASPPPTASTQGHPLTQKSALSPTPPPPQPAAPAAPEISPTALNAFAVSQLSGRPDCRPPKIDDGKLLENYKPAARRITYALVALPIAIVTSWVLYQRLILGEERKRLVPDSGDE